MVVHSPLKEFGTQQQTTFKMTLYSILVLVTSHFEQQLVMSQERLPPTGTNLPWLALLVQKDPKDP